METSNSKLEVTPSDNSHILGVPFIIKQEDHAFLEITRAQSKQYIKGITSLALDFHILYKED